MDDDLLDLISTVRALDLLATFAPQEWPPAAREMCGMVRGLAQNVAGVRKIVANQDALIETLRKEIERAHGEIAGLRAAIQAEHQN